MVAICFDRSDKVTVASNIPRLWFVNLAGCRKSASFESRPLVLAQAGPSGTKPVKVTSTRLTLRWAAPFCNGAMIASEPCWRLRSRQWRWISNSLGNDEPNLGRGYGYPNHNGETNRIFARCTERRMINVICSSSMKLSLAHYRLNEHGGTKSILPVWQQKCAPQSKVQSARSCATSNLHKVHSHYSAVHGIASSPIIH